LDVAPAATTGSTETR